MSTLIFLAVITIGSVLYSLFKSLRRPENFPPGPEFMPWMGNSIQLRKEAIRLGGQHMVFQKWSQQYKTNVLGLKLGKDLVVVGLTYPVVKEILLQEVFEGRPDNFFLRLRTMGTRKGITCTDGKLWYEHRNFAMKQMRQIGYGRTQMEEHIERETDNLLNYIEKSDGNPIWPGSFLAQSVISVLWCLAAGKRIERDDKRLTHLLDLLNRRSKIFDVCGGILTQFSWLRFIIPNKSGYNLVRELNVEFYNFFMETIEEHKSKYSKDIAGNDFIFAYLHEMNERPENCDNTFNETQLIMTILDLFIAGSQTTSTTIDLALMMLAIRNDVQQKVYNEVAANLKNDCNEYPHLSSRTSYPYTDAYLMEIQRYFNIVPTSGPRRALWNTTLDGYNIPKGTTILIGLNSVLMDEDHWGDPKNFRPERFLDTTGKTFRDEYFMPFALGRRRCLGDTLARACFFTFLIKILSRFRIECTMNEKPSLTLEPGITLSPKPYKVKFIKR